MKTKTVKIGLDDFGSFLGRERGCFTVKNREGKAKRHPLFENEVDERIQVCVPSVFSMAWSQRQRLLS
jgi:hypothetical protein